jgi:voltage-gated potassium channel
MTLQIRLLLTLLLIVAVCAVGAVGFHLIEGWPWFDGLYMTVITMTTVGYGEIRPLSHEGRIFNIFLILSSVTAGGLLLATATQALLEFELGSYLGRRRLEKEIEKLKGHYIICGAGRVGRTVAREFRAHNIPFLIIEIDQQKADWAMKEGIPVLIGSGATEDSLKLARIEHAKGLVSAVTSDADNLYIVLTASGLRPGMPIIARASEEEAIPKLRRAGATQVLSPYQFIGHRIVQLVLRPHVLDFIDSAFGSERMDIQIEEILIPDDSKLAGKTLEGAEIRKRTGVMIVALKKTDGTMTFSPAADVVLCAGDHLIAIGSSSDLEKLETIAGM